MRFVMDGKAYLIDFTDGPPSLPGLNLPEASFCVGPIDQYSKMEPVKFPESE